MPGPEGDEEELTSGPPERGPRTRLGRLRLDLLIGAVILGAVIVVGRAMSHGGSSAARKPQPTPTPSAPVGGFGSGAPDPGSGLLNGAATFSVRVSNIVVRPNVPIPPVLPASGDPAQCPSGIGCYAVESAPPPALAAVRAAYPGMVQESATTVRLDVKNYGQALWFMQIKARQGSKQIVVQLQAPRAEDHMGAAVTHVGGGTRTTYGDLVNQYYVSVRVDAPGPHAEPVEGLRILANDVRLLDRG